MLSGCSEFPNYHFLDDRGQSLDRHLTGMLSGCSEFPNYHFLDDRGQSLDRQRKSAINTGLAAKKSHIIWSFQLYFVSLHPESTLETFNPFIIKLLGSKRALYLVNTSEEFFV
jgi:hypothetical protein